MTIEEWKKHIDGEQKRIAFFLRATRASLKKNLSDESAKHLLTDDELEKIAGMLAYAVYPMPQQLLQTDDNTRKQH
jgi:hypothetical protein